MAFLDNEGLSYFWNKLKGLFLQAPNGNLKLEGNEYLQVSINEPTVGYNKKLLVLKNTAVGVEDAIIAKFRDILYIGGLGHSMSVNLTYGGEVASFWDTNIPPINVSTNKDLLGKIAIGDAEEDYQATTLGQVKSLIAESSSPGGVNSVSVTLNSFDWEDNEQTVTVDGIVADETEQLITPVPSNDNQDEYYSCGIKCKSQAENSLTFKADEVPTSNLTVYVLLQGV